MFCAVRWLGLISTWVINYDLHSPAAAPFRGYFFAGAWLAASFAGAASAQENAGTFHSKVNVVQVPVVLRDPSGRAVGNLTQGDFELFDKGKQSQSCGFVKA
jgi:hypothetical protein